MILLDKYKTIDNFNTNINVNINSNKNDFSLDEYGINQAPPYYEGIYRIRTTNKFLLIDDETRVVQTSIFLIKDIEKWDFIPTGDLVYIQNVATKRYMAVAEPVPENHIPIVTVPDRNPYTTRWLLYDIAHREGVQISNIVTGKVLDVPENSDVRGTQLIQYRRKDTNESIANQQFFIG